VVAYRKLDSYTPESRPRNEVICSFGTDWGAVAAAWFTQWERTLDPKIFAKLTNSMKTIAAQPRQFYTGSAYMDTNTGKFEVSKSNQVVVSHLNAVFGLVEICNELIQNLDVPSFKTAWLDYCRLYNASPEEQKKELGEVLELNKMTREHSRITAYAANILKDKNLGQRAWTEFLSRKGGRIDSKDTKVIYPPLVLYPVTENASVSTNAVAQWSLAAIQNLAWAKQWIGNKKFTPNEK
jgi:YetA-like protein